MAGSKRLKATFDQGEEARMWRCLLRWAAQMDYLSC